MPRTKSVISSCNKVATVGVKVATVGLKESFCGYSREKMQQLKLLLQVGEKGCFGSWGLKRCNTCNRKTIFGGCCTFFCGSCNTQS